LVRESMDVHEHLENDLMPLFHGGNRGSNPLGDAKYINVIAPTGRHRPKYFPKIHSWMVLDDAGAILLGSQRDG